jgi:hypothetical protein
MWDGKIFSYNHIVKWITLNFKPLHLSANTGRFLPASGREERRWGNSRTQRRHQRVVVSYSFYKSFRRRNVFIFTYLYEPFWKFLLIILQYLQRNERCCYITVDSATPALQNGACTYQCISKQIHYKTPFFIQWLHEKFGVLWKLHHSCLSGKNILFDYTVSY